MKHNKKHSLNRLNKMVVGLPSVVFGCYSIMPRAAPETQDTLRAFLAKHVRYGNHR